MRSMIIRGNFSTCSEILATSIITCKIFVFRIHATIQHCNDYRTVAGCVIIPYREYVDISTCNKF